MKIGLRLAPGVFWSLPQDTSEVSCLTTAFALRNNEYLGNERLAIEKRRGVTVVNCQIPGVSK